jgi:hypothetical protein
MRVIASTMSFLSNRRPIHKSLSHISHMNNIMQEPLRCGMQVYAKKSWEEGGNAVRGPVDLLDLQPQKHTTFLAGSANRYI